MFDNLLSTEALVTIIPLILIQFSLVIYCVVNIFKYGVANLNKWAWVVIVIFGSLLGAVAYLMIGRRKDI